MRVGYIGGRGAGATTFHLKHIDYKLRTSSMPYLFDIAEGNVADHEPWSKTGFNPDIGVAMETLWAAGGTYAFPASAMQMQAVSSDNTQDKAGGTGALKVTIIYLNASYVEATEEITLNGTTAVDTVATDIFRINYTRITSVGTNGAPVGNISIKGKIDGITYGYCTAGFNRARQCVYTVPAGKVLYVTSYLHEAGGSTKPFRMINRATYDSMTKTVLTAGKHFMPYGETILTDETVFRPLEIPTKLPATVDLKVSGIGTAVGSTAGVQLRGWLEDA